MIVYVESNFVLAIALGQEDSGPAGVILDSAERGRLDLAFPALVAEPFSTIAHRGRERRRLAGALGEQVREIGRSQPHLNVASLLRPVPAALTDLEQREADLLLSTLRRLLAVGRSLTADVSVLDEAVSYRRNYDLSPADAIVLASITVDLAATPAGTDKCFMSKNWKDFGHPGIVAALAARNCAFVESFDAAYALVVSRFPSP